MSGTGSDRNKRRMLVTFTKQQRVLIKMAVDLGMALNEAEYVRRAVDEMNKQVPIYQKLRKLQENNVKLKELDEILAEHDL